jgi:hypothetical protein
MRRPPGNPTALSHWRNAIVGEWHIGCIASHQHADPLLGQQGNAADSGGTQLVRSDPCGSVFFWAKDRIGMSAAGALRKPN